MKTIIIYASFHHKNTEKLAKVIAENLGAEIISFKQVKEEDILSADLIGFGSGVYFSKFHPALINLVKKLPQLTKQKVFLFSSAGMKKNIIFNRAHSHFKKLLKKKSCQIVGEFDCLAYDSYGILKFFGGINKGRPNQEDLVKAKKFALSLKK